MRICRSRDSGITYSPEFLRLPHSLRRCKDFRATIIRQRLVWICLLDSYGLGFSSLQVSLATKKESRMDQIHYIYVFHWYLLPHCSLLRLAISNGLCSGHLLSAISLIMLWALHSHLRLRITEHFVNIYVPSLYFLKPMSYFSVLRIKCDKDKCISCGKCKRVCPMNVDVTDNSRKRKNGTECILCMECVRNCPKDAL